MKTKLLISVLIGLLLYVIDLQLHFISDRTVQIKNVHQKKTIRLTKREGQEHVFGFAVHVYGDIKGTAKLALSQDSSKGTLHEEEVISGHTDLEWGGDWYTDTIDIVYEPLGEVDSGELEIAYEFKGIWSW